MASSVVSNIISELSSNPEIKDKLLDAMGIDLLTITKDGFKNILNNISKQNKEMNKIWQEIRALNQAYKDATDKNWQAIQDLRKDNIKIWQEIQDLKKESTKIWQEIQRQNEEIKNLREDFQNQFSKLHRRLDKHEDYLKGSGGMALEQYSLLWFKGILQSKLIPAEKLVWRKKLKDPDMELGTEIIEIDIFQDDPLIVVEVTSYLSNIKKLTTFIKKINIIKKIYKKEPHSVFICYRIENDIEDSVVQLCDTNNIMLITIGRKTDFDFND